MFRSIAWVFAGIGFILIAMGLLGPLFLSRMLIAGGVASLVISAGLDIPDAIRRYREARERGEGLTRWSKKK
jgi:hypothetical protein